MARPNAVAEMLSFKGRIGRGEWWLIAFGFSILSSVVSFGAATVLIGAEEFGPGLRNHPVFHQIQLAMSVILFWPILAASVKRAHDRGGPGLLPFVYMVINLGMGVIQVVRPDLFEMAPTGAPTSEELAFAAVALGGLVLGVWLLITLGFLPGKKGPNRYGPSPKGSGSREYQAPRID